MENKAVFPYFAQFSRNYLSNTAVLYLFYSFIFPFTLLSIS